MAWGACRAFYGQGFGAAASVASFGPTSMMVVLIERVARAVAKTLHDRRPAGLISNRLYARAEEHPPARRVSAGGMGQCGICPRAKAR